MISANKARKNINISKKNKLKKLKNMVNSRIKEESIAGGNSAIFYFDIWNDYIESLECKGYEIIKGTAWYTVKW